MPRPRARSQHESIAAMAKRRAIVVDEIQRVAGQPRTATPARTGPGRKPITSQEVIERYGRELLRRAPADFGVDSRRWSYRQLAIVLRTDFGWPQSEALLRSVLTERLRSVHPPLHNISKAPEEAIRALVHRIARDARGGRMLGYHDAVWTLERIAEAFQRALGVTYAVETVKDYLRRFLGPHWWRQLAAPRVKRGTYALPSGWLDELAQELARGRKGGRRPNWTLATLSRVVAKRFTIRVSAEALRKILKRQAGGWRAWRDRVLGSRPSVSDQLRRELPNLVNAVRSQGGEGGWSVRRVAALMRQEWGTSYSEGYTYKLLVGAFGPLWHEALGVERSASKGRPPREAKRASTSSAAPAKKLPGSRVRRRLPPHP